MATHKTTPLTVDERISLQASPNQASEPSTRRHLLKLGAAAAGVAVSGALLSHQPANAQTGVSATSSDTDPAILGTNTGGGAGVQGSATNGGTGVEGNSDSGIGVEAVSNTGNGVFALTRSGIGVYGVVSQGDFGIGGVNLTSGVLGLQAYPDAAGVLAIALPPGGTALRVLGKASFSTAGSSTVAAGARSATVSDTAVGASSHVTVVLTSDPGNKASVHWVKRLAGIGFVVHTDRPVANATSFSYLVVEP